MKSVRKTSKRRSNGGKKITHAPTRACTCSRGCFMRGFLRACPRASFCAIAGRDGSVWTGRSSLGRFGSRAERQFGLGPTRLRTPDAFLQPTVATCRSSILPRSSVRRPTHGGDAFSLLHFFPNFPETVSFAFSIHFLQIFLSFNP